MKSSRGTLGYQPTLDGLRAAAILAVVATHVTAYTGRGGPIAGWQGVTVFFVLSGFLITTLLLEEHGRTGGIDLRSFYIRRVARLMPAFAVAALAYSGWAIYDHHASTGRIITATVLALLYIGNLWQSVRWYLPGPGHAWSLAIEEQFYLARPLLLRRMLARPDGIRRLAVFCVGVFAAAQLARVVAVVEGSSAAWTFTYYISLCRADALAVGCIAALWRYNGGRIDDPLRAAWVAVALLAPAVMFRPPTASHWLDVALFPVVIVGTGVLILCVLDGRAGWLSRALSLPWAVHIGRLSYSLYLWHLFAFNFIRWLAAGAERGVKGDVLPLWGVPVALALSWALSEASLRLVERPARRAITARWHAWQAGRDTAKAPSRP